jgi:hypothetical protein
MLGTYFFFAIIEREKPSAIKYDPGHNPEHCVAAIKNSGTTAYM